jgi:UDP-2,3-diacylglucosamine hydrolase
LSNLQEVDLPPGTRVVGDLHLDVEQPKAVALFCAWLGSLSDCPRLVILGDLFEYWIGMAQAESEGGLLVLEAMRGRVAAGTEIDVIPGNRDFLLDGRFEARSGAKVRHEGFLGRLPGGERVLFLHGDELCIHDHSYQRLRRVLRSGPLLWLAPHLPTGLARGLARRLRRASKSAVAAKPGPQKQQMPEAAVEQLGRRKAQILVVGHAHRFRDEDLGSAGRWLVVDGFGGPRDQLRVGADGDLLAESSGSGHSPPPETSI